jgi:beta-phosphoglucomutase-like phosphatase (HAD superfamily)
VKLFTSWLRPESRTADAGAALLGSPHSSADAIRGRFPAAGRELEGLVERFRAPESFAEDNLYPDARPCLEALRAQGLLVGLAGNQTARAERILRSWIYRLM